MPRFDFALFTRCMPAASPGVSRPCPSLRPPRFTGGIPHSMAVPSNSTGAVGGDAIPPIVVATAPNGLTGR